MPFEIRRCLPVITLEPLDLLLANHSHFGEGITIVQVGACDGVTNDPIWHALTRPSNRAILIEPNPLAFARLKAAYVDNPNITCIQAAIGQQDGEAYLYRVKLSGSSDASADQSLQISSFYKEHLEKHGRKGDDIERITVPCRTLPSLLSEFGVKKVDLLQIDAEGFDAAVVRMAMEMPAKPNCINFEHIHLKGPDRKPLFKLLDNNNYLLSYDEWNILAMQRSLLSRPRNL